MSEFIVWFEDITADDVARVGGKNASLGVGVAYDHTCL